MAEPVCGVDAQRALETAPGRRLHRHEVRLRGLENSWAVKVMDEVEISINRDSIRFWFDQIIGFPDTTSYFGGYDVWGRVEIQCGHYHAHGSLEFTTGEVWQFYTDLLKAYNDLAGKAAFRSTNGNLEFTVAFGSLGHFVLSGAYQEHELENTKLTFEMKGDQSYLGKSLSQLAQLVAKYGDIHGLPKVQGDIQGQKDQPQRSKWPPYR
jgi:hypothetical protein